MEEKKPLLGLCVVYKIFVVIHTSCFFKLEAFCSLYRKCLSTPFDTDCTDFFYCVVPETNQKSSVFAASILNPNGYYLRYQPTLYKNLYIEKYAKTEAILAFVKARIGDVFSVY